MHDRRKKRGFTMAETLLVVAIIGVLSGVVFIMVARYMRSMAQLERDGIAKEIFVSAQNHLTMAESQGYLGKTSYGTPETDSISGSGDNTGSGSGTAGSGIYYFVVNHGDAFSTPSVLNLMLPFGSVDETVRLGGNYIIRYQAQPALVLDVFYCNAQEKRYGHTFTSGEYKDLLDLRDVEGRNHKSERRTYVKDKAVLGWYGGEEAQKLEKGKELAEPSIEIVNAERLLVKIKDPNEKYGYASLVLIVTGKTSGKQKAFYLKKITDKNIYYDNMNAAYTVILDSVTESGMHFAELFGESGFIPGEDVTVQAVSYSNTVLTNIAYSAGKSANSLFAEIAAAEGAGSSSGDSSSSEDDFSGSPFSGDDGFSSGDNPGSGSGNTSTGGLSGNVTASISNIRHLENLGNAVSDANGTDSDGAVYAIKVTSASQTTDLDWNTFCTAVSTDKDLFEAGSASDVCVYKNSGSSSDKTAAGTYWPVTPAGALAYDGLGHAVSNIRIQFAGDAGLFGTLSQDSSISNLQLLNCAVTSTGAASGSSDSGNAGTLAGTMTKTKVSNVLARLETKTGAAASDGSSGGAAGSSPGSTSASSAGQEAFVSVSGGGSSAGGLVGSMSGGSLTGCAASVYVQVTKGDGSSAAGGLVGTASGSAVLNGCYAGGHTQDGLYPASPAAKAAGSGPGSGSSSGSSLAGEYDVLCTSSGSSTDGSSPAGTAGGFIGSAGDASMTACYSTCSVSGETEGGFAGTGNGDAVTCYATGYVNCTDGQADSRKAGAFAGYWTGDASNCRYYEIINEIAETVSADGDGGSSGGGGSSPGGSASSIWQIRYLPAAGNASQGSGSSGGSVPGISAFDSSLETYNDFVGDGSNWESADAYDALLIRLFEGRYCFPNIEQLLESGGSASGDVPDIIADAFAGVHYGDWPVPEILAENEK